jgi:hypothetical protein
MQALHHHKIHKKTQTGMLQRLIAGWVQRQVLAPQ